MLLMRNLYIFILCGGKGEIGDYCFGWQSVRVKENSEFKSALGNSYTYCLVWCLSLGKCLEEVNSENTSTSNVVSKNETLSPLLRDRVETNELLTVTSNRHKSVTRHVTVDLSDIRSFAHTCVSHDTPDGETR